MIPTSATAAATAPSLSVSFAALLSVSSALTEAALSNAPPPSMVAVTVMVTSLAGVPDAILGMVHGKPVHPPPLTVCIVKLVGVSLTTTLLAVSGPALLTTKV